MSRGRLRLVAKGQPSTRSEGIKQPPKGCINVACAPLREQRQETMRQILETEDHVAVPPMMYSDPFYRITYLIKEEIRKYKWIERRKRPATLVERGQG